MTSWRERAPTIRARFSIVPQGANGEAWIPDTTFFASL